MSVYIVCSGATTAVCLCVIYKIINHSERQYGNVYMTHGTGRGYNIITADINSLLTSDYQTEVEITFELAIIYTQFILII